MDVGDSEDKAILAVTAIDCGLPRNQIFNLIHVFLSIRRDSDFQVETRSKFVPGGR